jgi:Mrp family chromosome partitioning ATPase
MSERRRVLLIDGHLTRQSLSKHFQLTGLPGIAEACANVEKWPQLIHPTDDERIWVLPGGGRLDRKGIRQHILLDLVPKIRQQFDIVMVDVGLPDSPLAVPSLTACDCSYLVVRLGRTERESAKRVLATLSERNLAPNGCIITNVRK